jgi:hypothetical protein
MRHPSGHRQARQCPVPFYQQSARAWAASRRCVLAAMTRHRVVLHSHVAPAPYLSAACLARHRLLHPACCCLVALGRRADTPWPCTPCQARNLKRHAQARRELYVWTHHITSAALVLAAWCKAPLFARLPGTVRSAPRRVLLPGTPGAASTCTRASGGSCVGAGRQIKKPPK